VVEEVTVFYATITAMKNYSGVEEQAITVLFGLSLSQLSYTSQEEEVVGLEPTT